MAFTPNTNMQLLSVPWDNSYTNVLNFKNLAQQHAVMVSCISFGLNAVTYQKKDDFLAVAINYEILTKNRVNYLMYQNTNFGDKWFYAFVTKIVYENATTSYVYYETDVYQTWLFDIRFLPSFVVREHIEGDYPGANTIDEGLETGEYIFVNTKLTGHFSQYYIAVATTLRYGETFGRVYSGVGYALFESGYDFWAWHNALPGEKQDTITTVFMIPREFVRVGVPDPFTNTYHFVKVAFGGEIIQKNTKPPDNGRPAGLGGYIPKNKKLLTYPYNYLLVTNQAGQMAKYRYEYFSNPSDINFNIACNISPSPVAYCYPKNYKLQENNFNEVVTLSNFPQIAWTTDVYAQWLAQNSASTTLSFIGGAGAIIGGGAMLATGAGAVVGAGMIAGGVGTVANQIGQIYEHSIQAPEGRGAGGVGSINIDLGVQDFMLAQCCITGEKAQILDDFFSMYGYKTSRLKIPNLNTRPYWNYVKTIDINVIGTVPQDDLEKVRAIYNNGVTIWHDSNNMYRYDLNNA